MMKELKLRREHVGYEKTKLFSFNRIEMLQQLFLMEKNPIHSWSIIGSNGIDPSSGVFIEWLGKKLRGKTKLPNNATILRMVKSYNEQEEIVKKRWEKEHNEH